MLGENSLKISLVIVMGWISLVSAAPRISSQALILLQQYEYTDKEGESNSNHPSTQLEALLNSFKNILQCNMTVVPTPKPQEPNKTSEQKVTLPDICQDSSIDAAVRTKDGRIYFFKGQYYYESDHNGKMKQQAKEIYKDWSGLSGNLDAAFTWPDGETVFFKRSLYWKFVNKKMVPGHPKRIQDGFPGIPENLDAAFLWTKNNVPYFFKGNNYWRFDRFDDEKVKKDYPVPISGWKGIPNNVDAAFGEALISYFFQDKYYFKYSDSVENVEGPIRPIAEWFDCKNKLEGA